MTGQLRVPLGVDLEGSLIEGGEEGGPDMGMDHGGKLK